MSIATDQLERALAFYDKALAALGIERLKTYEDGSGKPVHVGFGHDRMPYFWIARGAPSSGVHIAFRASRRQSVDAFYSAALHAGGRDNGPPGLRGHYHRAYYGAFVLDPDGVNVEAVCHSPEDPLD